MGMEEYFKRFLDFFKGLSNSDIVLDGYTIEYLLREAHETIFGITDLTNKDNPLAIISYTNADTLGDTGSVAEMIQTYRSSEILEKYGLSIKDYMDLPIDFAKLLISNSKTEKEDTAGIMHDAERKAQNELKKTKR